ncbi:efflux RND transporter permease subunit [Gluconobacter albidus]|uniref:Nodulation protein n=1 Tax=Gluconobacter albidus TaxID=318683 RepID=A0AAW3QZN6_9PROT|nr:efflux RND transporter permease subunit [Gluconobacter albidus]KXV41600.1 nodulation protein [Gluconobacter albidus]GBQ89790.1 multidrug efflux pump acriflavin resistance protein AcrB/AcrD/AcrF [Gluconobacter albidus NBRC 3250]GLQ69636.1 transport system membrane protein [Gluconobacter albidus]
MNFCRLFIDRPVATTLMSIAIFMAGLICYPLLPVATMPDMTTTSIMVVATQPGADPQQMATSVTTPLERRLGSIADLESIESDTSAGQAQIFLEFSSSRNIDGALRDTQAALRAARADLPTGTMDADPQAFKMDGGGFPVYLMSLTGDQKTQAELYDIANIRIKPLLAEVKGVGRVEVVGSTNPAVRVELNPNPLYKWGIGLEDIRTALASANAFTPKGFIDSHGQRMMLSTNDQAINAAQYRDLIVGYRNDFYPVRLSDIATVTDSVQDVYQTSYINGHRAVTLVVTAQPHANTVAIVDGINANLTHLRDALPADVNLVVGLDTSRSIRASLADARLTLILSVVLVVLVILLFFRRMITTLIPAVTVPIALSGTLAAMAAFNFTLDVLSLMSLTIAVGFVVDDAIVVLENIARHMEEGKDRYTASLIGSSEIGFTVLSISASLVAVFIPLLFLPGGAGSIMFEFCMTMISAIVISMWLSLTLTPMMCARMLEIDHGDQPRKGVVGSIAFVTEASLDWTLKQYGRSMHWCLRHPVLMGLTLPLSFVVLIGSVMLMPKEFIPSQDMSLLAGRIKGDPTMSFQEIDRRLREIGAIAQTDPDVTSTTIFSDDKNSGELYIHLKEKDERASAETILDRIRKRLPTEPGADVSFWSVGGSSQGGSSSKNTGSYRYVLRGDNVSDLFGYVPILLNALRASGKLVNISSTTEGQSAAAYITVQRDTEARYGVTPQLIQNVLYDSYGQAIVSTIHLPTTEHRVVMVLAPKYRMDPETLRQVWISTSAGTAAGGVASNLIRARSDASTSASSFTSLATASIQNSLANQLSGNTSSGAAVSSAIETMIPLMNVASILWKPQPLDITHRGNYYSANISFDLATGVSYNDAVALIKQTMQSTHAPDGVLGDFTGTAGDTRKLMINGALAFLAAIAVMYIVLGILYESLIHPITILSTLPSAGIGAVLGLWIAGESFSIIAMIGIILLTGIVKKNAILVIDFAIHAERVEKLSPKDAIFKASITRFRPILMTSLAAALGAVPLIISNGYGAEMRRPLGVSILGGMVVSQLLTLYTTPIVYLWMDAIGARTKRLYHWLLGLLRRHNTSAPSARRT